MPEGPSPTNWFGWIRKFTQDGLVHVGEGRRPLPGHHNVAVIERASEQAESRSHHALSLTERVSQTNPRLHIPIIGGVHFAVHPHVSRRREKVHVITQPESKSEVRSRFPLVLCVRTRELVPELQVSTIVKVRGCGAGI